jgi:hypothetical protein
MPALDAARVFACTDHVHRLQGFAYDRPIAQRRVTRVQDANTAWYAQEAHWILIEDLLQGTYGMRKKHRRYCRRSRASLMSPTTTA